MIRKNSHAFVLALIFEVAGEARVADYCRENRISLTPVRFTHSDVIGELVALGGDVFTIVPLGAVEYGELRLV